MKEINNLFARLKLGVPRMPPQILNGGQMHHCFLVIADEYSWVVKKLNTCVVNTPEFPGNYEQSEQIAQNFKYMGLNAVCAKEFEHRFVQKSGNYYLIYPFVDGQVLKGRSITLSHATKMGEVFARLHVKTTNNIDVQWNIHTHDQWVQVLAISREFVNDDLAHQILCWNERYNCVIPDLNHELVVSHRDLHYGNVIWDQNNQPHLIDWESAGIINPNVELIGYGLEWSGVLLGSISYEIFHEIIRSYEKFRVRTSSVKEAYEGWLGHCLLPWFFFNLKRRYGLVSSDSSEIERGRAVLEGGLLKSLYFLMHHEKDIISSKY